jgi:hypothetical protein
LIDWQLDWLASGSGIFVSDAGDKGGRLNVRRLETDAVYSDGGIAPGTPDQITGGVFTVYGAHVDVVRNREPVVTYGVNDMVLDRWGVVDRWTAEEKITSYGPSGIGFVNFGIMHELKVNALIETFGLGARGFNVYTGTVNLAEFDRVLTHADGAVGVQISQPIGRRALRNLCSVPMRCVANQAVLRRLPSQNRLRGRRDGESRHLSRSGEGAGRRRCWTARPFNSPTRKASTRSGGSATQTAVSGARSCRRTITASARCSSGR